MPEVFAWDISHGFGSPCDSFEVSIALAQDTQEILERAVYFSAESGGKTVFCGIIDEFELVASAGGAMAFLRGRGLQARLLDNEAESAQHYLLSLDTLLDTYARPFGIDRIDTGAAQSVRGNLTVDSGASCWSVLSEFCRFHADTVPRFAPDGTLCIDGEKGGRELVIGGKTPVTSMSYCEDRYGVVSSVIVKNKARGTRAEMQSSSYAEKGLCCRRVITVPRATGYDTMRHTGAYQIARSAEDMIKAELTLPWEFAAFAGDMVTIEASPVGAKGRFIVRESRCRGGGEGAQTALLLARAR